MNNSEPTVKTIVGGQAVLWPFLLLIVSQILFASNQILARFIHGEIPPIGLSFWRWIVATLVVLPFTIKYIRQYGGLIIKEWRIYLGISFCLIVMGNTTIYIALNYTTAINGAIVSSVQPAFTFALSWIIYREFVTKWQIVGAIIATLGVIYVISRGDFAFLVNLRPNPGDMWMILSVIGFSLYAVLLRRLPPSVPAILTLNVIQCLGIVLLIPLYAWESLYYQPMTLNFVTIISVFWAGIMVAVAAIGLWNYANLKLGANKASGTIHLRLIFITIAAIVVLGEQLELFHVIGCVIIMLGVYAITKPENKIS
jgi:drug/metabolite transporter (DMT)-like permease